jgi:hypothetical protein
MGIQIAACTLDSSFNSALLSEELIAAAPMAIVLKGQQGNDVFTGPAPAQTSNSF